MAIDLKSLTGGTFLRPSAAAEGSATGAIPVAPPRTPRSHRIQRLQIGAAGLGAILLVVGIASIIKDRVDQTEATIVADAGDVAEPEAEPAAPNDALVDAGLVPDLPAEAEPEQLPDPELSDTPAQTAPQPNDGTGQ